MCEEISVNNQIFYDNELAEGFSYSFANGQIDGYFGTPPSEFWKVFKFYVALYAFEHLSFADGTLEDIEYRIPNATRMLTLFGERFELDIPLFRG